MMCKQQRHFAKLAIACGVLFVVILVIALTSCGGAPPAGNKVHSSHQALTPALQAQWEQAQDAIGRLTWDMNAAIVPPYGTAQHDWRTPDPRALTLTPDFDVVLVDDSAEPGVILTPSGQRCSGYTQGNTIYWPASRANVSMVYEICNWILLTLGGYPMGGR